MDESRSPFLRFRLPFMRKNGHAAGSSAATETPGVADAEGQPGEWVTDSRNNAGVGIEIDDSAVLVDVDASEEDSDAVHDVLKRTDVWFAFHATALEREATQLAEKHAEKGQPRHDLERDGPLEMELLLEQQAKEVIWGWADRVKRKMQGAVETETEKVGVGLSAARQSVANASAAREAMGRYRRSTEIRFADLRSQLEALRNREPGSTLPAETIECERHMPNLWFWPLMVLLVMADFFANVPVFTELFPANKLVDAAFATWEEQVLSQDLPSWFGVAHLFKRIAVYPESAILALSVVVFFVFLGHALGGSLRSLVLLWTNRRDSGLHSIRNAFRQAGWPTGLTLCGILLTVCVLYVARAKVLPMAESRVEMARQELTAVQAELSKLQDQHMNVPADLFTRDAEAQENVRAREQRVDYAQAINGMNVPIALLNVVLVIAAVVTGYMREKRTFSVSAAAEGANAVFAGRRAESIQAELGEIQATLEGFRAEFIQRRQAAHDSLRAVSTAILRAQHLLESDLLRDWYGKAERVRRAIPLFRSENARLRGLDAGDILAFRTPHIMNLPAPGELATALDRPPALAAYSDEYAQLRDRLYELDREGTDELLAGADATPSRHPQPMLSV